MQALFGTYTTLTEGQSIAVSVGEEEDAAQIELFVTELRPARVVLVVDTELEVEFDQSVVAETRAFDERRRAGEEAARQAELAAEAKRQEQAAAAAATRAKASRQDDERRRAANRAAAAAALPPEPDAGAGVVTVLVRMPDGPRISRRFTKTTALSQVRQWVESASPPERMMASFDLVSNFPRFTASEANSDVSLKGAGLDSGGGATFFVSEADVELD